MGAGVTIKTNRQEEAISFCPVGLSSLQDLQRTGPLAGGDRDSLLKPVL